MKDNLTFLCTAIGSLPHNDIDEAINVVENNFQDIPFLPQLDNVNKYENITYQCIENLAGLKIKNNKMFIDKNDIDIDAISNNINDYEINYYSALTPFLKLIKKNNYKYAKAQLIGPFSLSMLLNEKSGEKVYFDKYLREVIINHIMLKALWLANKIKSTGVKPIIFLDEPLLTLVGPYSNISREDVLYMVYKIVNRLKSENIIVGIHCCGKCDWSIISDSLVDILSFDAFTYSKDFSGYYKKIKKYINNGGIIAWGIVPTMSADIVERLTLDALYLGFYMSVNYLTEFGIDKYQILNSSVITPSCGTGNLSVEYSEKVMRLTHDLSLKLKEN